MNQIIITEAITNCDRPYTLTLKGTIGHSSFYADLEGVCLNIKSSHPLTNNQVSKLKKKLQETFPVPLNGKFKQDEIDEIVERSSLVFRV